MWSRRFLPVAAGSVALLLVAAVAVVLLSREDPVRVSAHFDRAVGLYEGSDVRILGVRVGQVTKITPVGDSVRVDMEYAAKYQVPAAAKAVIIAPSVVSDRYVQLTPAYRGGPTLSDGASIPLGRTATPVELDAIFTSLNDLTVALGPDGANRDGAFARLLAVGAENLDGQGARLNQTVGDLSQAVTTLSEGRDDMFDTVRNLQVFTSALAANDEQLRAFNDDLATVAAQLAGEREELRVALRNLAIALDEIATFVRENKDALAANVAQLADLSQTLANQRAALEETLDVAPLVLSNLQLAYNPSAGTLDTRNNAEQLADPALYLCSLLRAVGEPQSTCDAVNDAFAQLPIAPAGETEPGLDRTLGGILGGGS